jgi:hypothetical protein
MKRLAPGIQEAGCMQVRLLILDTMWPHSLWKLEDELKFVPGAATRISLDLGLHIDTAARVEDGSMTIRAAHARSVAFWGSFLTDR